VVLHPSDQYDQAQPRQHFIAPKQHCVTCGKSLEGFWAKYCAANISFALHENEILGVIGPSGGGKTTLLKCLNLLETFDRGSIEFREGLKILADGDKALKASRGVLEESLTEEVLNGIRREVGFVFQSFNLWEEKTVIENLCWDPRLFYGSGGN